MALLKEHNKRGPKHLNPSFLPSSIQQFIGNNPLYKNKIGQSLLMSIVSQKIMNFFILKAH